jgi:subtilase family serine protease
LNHARRPAAVTAAQPTKTLKRCVTRWGLLATLAAGCVTPAAPADPRVRLDPGAIDEAKLVTLAGNTHPSAKAQNSLGKVEDSFVLEHLQLVLKRSPALETTLQTHIDALHDRTSPLYQQWLTGQQFGDQYGVAPADVATITAWLTAHGMHVDNVPPSRMFIEFTGTAAQVSAAFHTEIHRLQAKGALHLGNMRDPQIPEELAKAVVGVHALHDFMPRSMRRERGAVKRNPTTGAWSMVKRSPSFTMPVIGACVENGDCKSNSCNTTTGACNCTASTQCSATAGGTAAACTAGTCVQCAANADCVFPATCNTTTKVCEETFYAVAPADFATIYNLNPAFAEGYTGLGQTVVVLEDTILKTVGDVATFRAAFGLSGYHGTFTQITATGTAATCTAAKANGAEGEAALDAEWAGAAAPDAAIELAACRDTTTVFGGLIALQNLINGATPPAIVSMSYGECEFENGVAANASFLTTYQQAAAAGTSVFVSSGDELAASCDADNTLATQGIGVSGFASTPYNVAVGGTDFMDNYNSAAGGPALSTYWNTTTSGATPYSSALSYIPEIPWNDSCASGLIYSTPSVALGTYTQAHGPSGFCNTTLGATFQSVGGGSGGPSNYATALGVGWPQPSWQTGVVGLPTKSGGVRNIPDVSLFAANGVWGHFYVYCMTDTKEGGGPCTFTNVADTLALAAGGTSFAAPAMAGIQALINQKMAGAPQGNPNYTYYRLAAAEYGAKGSARCNASSSTLPSAGCIFNDVTQGDIDVNCGLNTCTAATGCPLYGGPTGFPNQACTGGVCIDTCATAADCPQAGQACTAGVCTPTSSPNCFDSTGGTVNGALSTSTTAFSSAYAAGTGWDYATGLGTVNAYNLVNAWSQ